MWASLSFVYRSFCVNNQKRNPKGFTTTPNMDYHLLLVSLLITARVTLSKAGGDHCPSKTCLTQDSCTEKRLDEMEDKVEAVLKHQERLESLLSFYGESCEKLHSKGERKDGHYIINLWTEGLLKVVCNFTTNPVQTIIEHNYPTRTSANGSPNCEPGPGRLYKISYGTATAGQLKKLMEGKSCRQFLKYECYHSLLTWKGRASMYWVDRNGRKMSYWAGGPPGGHGCACSLDKTCAGGPSHVCNCERNDHVWRSDQGYITDTSSLPVTAIRVCDTDDAREDGYFTLGPLVCVQG